MKPLEKDVLQGLIDRNKSCFFKCSMSFGFTRK